MKLSDVITEVLDKAFKRLPAKFDTKEARLMLLSIGLQESRFESRRQLIMHKGKLLPLGPAVSYWQFEEGNPTSKGGVWGVLNHYRVGPMAHAICKEFGISPIAPAVWEAMETNDVLAACMARLLLYASPKALPAVGDVQGAWLMYLDSWRPGKPHEGTWPAHYVAAKAALGV